MGRIAFALALVVPALCCVAANSQAMPVAPINDAAAASPMTQIHWWGWGHHHCWIGHWGRRYCHRW